MQRERIEKQKVEIPQHKESTAESQKFPRIFSAFSTLVMLTNRTCTLFSLFGDLFLLTPNGVSDEPNSNLTVLESGSVCWWGMDLAGAEDLGIWAVGLRIFVNILLGVCQLPRGVIQQ